MSDKHTPDLSNKIVFISQLGRDHGITVQHPRFEYHNGRLLLVGKVPEGGSENDWLSGIKTHIAWDQVQECSVFDSLEDYHSRISRAWTDKNLQ